MNYRVFYSQWYKNYDASIEEIEHAELMRGDDQEADSVDEAAELYAEHIFESEADYSTDISIYVFDGKVWHSVMVDVRSEPVFMAYSSETVEAQL